MRVLLVSVSLWLSSHGCGDPRAAHQRDAMASALARAEADAREPTAEVALDAPLDRAALVSAVLARNPDLAAARASWRAIAAEAPAATAWPDPMVTYEVAPLSVGAAVPFGQRVELRQRLPFPGKRALAGDVVAADADAARADYQTLRLELAEATVHAFDDYYVAARALEVNAHHRPLLERVQRGALAQVSAARAGQQDVLEAEGELIALERDRLALDGQQRAARTRINRLLRRAVDAALPPPPARLIPAARRVEPPAPHPRQAAAEARTRARTAELAGARRAFYPDLEVMASYDSMWSDWQHQVMVGIGIELPLARGARTGGVERAQAEQARAQAELTSVTDALAAQRDDGQREADEATAALALYEQRAVPNAQARLDAALAGFTAGQATFAQVVMAEHGLREVELRLEQARAELDRKLATLDRISGRVAGGAP